MHKLGVSMWLIHNLLDYNPRLYLLYLCEMSIFVMYYWPKNTSRYETHLNYIFNFYENCR